LANVFQTKVYHRRYWFFHCALILSQVRTQQWHKIYQLIVIGTEMFSVELVFSLACSPSLLCQELSPSPYPIHHLFSFDLSEFAYFCSLQRNANFCVKKGVHLKTLPVQKVCRLALGLVQGRVYLPMVADIGWLYHSVVEHL